MNESAEDYIKTIYAMKQQRASIHAVDVANELGYSRASVSVAMANLRKLGIITVNPDGEIEFTKKGTATAKEIYEKHATLSDFLKTVAGVDEKTAKDDACKIEHFISESTYDGIKQFVSKHSGE